MRPNGTILWRGASLIDAKPIVAIAVGLTSKSSNRKTGAMLQTYILRSDLDPMRAIKQGKDTSICGACPHRGAAGNGKGRTCYVNVGQGPLAVYRAFKRKRYPQAQSAQDLGANRFVRLGTYGDPAAVPASIWQALVAAAAGHTGYTHQWRLRPELKRLCMASVDSPAEAVEAQLIGWRTFRVGMKGNAALENMRGTEVLCPASIEAGHKLKCEACLACGGADGRRSNIFIPGHGGFAVMSNIRKLAGIPIIHNGVD